MSELEKNGSLSSDIRIDELAESTHGFTGAEIESVVKNAVSLSIKSVIDINNINFSLNVLDKILINMSHFNKVIHGFSPMFGLGKNTVEELRLKIKVDHSHITSLIHKNLTEAHSSKIIGINGKQKSGKTSTACSVALKLIDEKKIKFVRYLNSSTFIDKPGFKKEEFLIKELRDQSGGLIILDNIEHIIDFVPPGIFNGSVFHLLKTIFSETKNHIIISTSNKDILSYLGFFESVNIWIEMREILQC